MGKSEWATLIVIVPKSDSYSLLRNTLENNVWFQICEKPNIKINSVLKGLKSAHFINQPLVICFKKYIIL